MNYILNYHKCNRNIFYHTSNKKISEYFLPFIQSYISLGLSMIESYLWYLILSKYSFPHNTFWGPFAIKWRHCFFSSLKTLFLSQSEVYRLKCPSDHSMSIYKRRLTRVLIFLRPLIEIKLFSDLYLVNCKIKILPDTHWMLSLVV